MSKNKRVQVWSLPVRCLHWMLVAGVVAAWATSSRTGSAHEYIGYGVAAIVVLRIVMGLSGGRYARFSQFIRGPRQTLTYLMDVLRSRAPRHLGHNPLGGWMVMALLAILASVTLTGWIATTDEFWGYAWPVRLHVACAWTLVLLVVLHVSGVLITSRQHSEDLVAAMVTGSKDRPQPGDIE